MAAPPRRTWNPRESKLAASMKKHDHPSSCHPDRKYHAKDLCLQCYQRGHYLANKNRYDEKAKRWRANNSERYKQTSTAYLKNNPSWYLWRTAKARAKKYGLDFSISTSDVVIPTQCPVLGIPLIPLSGKFAHNSPSIDRIDNKKGYVKGNIIVVSFRANSLKKDATIEELSKVAEFYLKLENR